MKFFHKSIAFALFKFLLLTFSVLYINPVLAEENLYDRGKELVEQKEYQKAIKAFERLSLNYPEKSIYFADQIKSVEDLIKEK